MHKQIGYLDHLDLDKKTDSKVSKTMMVKHRGKIFQTYTIVKEIQEVRFLPQPNSTQPRVGLALFSYANHNHNAYILRSQKPNRIPLYLRSYTTKLDQIQYATLFQPN